MTETMNHSDADVISRRIEQGREVEISGMIVEEEGQVSEETDSRSLRRITSGDADIWQITKMTNPRTKIIRH